MRLPTEVEWLYVATGRGEGRVHPWGGAVPTTCTDALHALDGRRENPCRGPRPVPAADGDLSRDGVHDLAGGLREFVFGSLTASNEPPATLPKDWAGAPRDARQQVLVRGGDSATPSSGLATVKAVDAIRYHEASTRIGFRCARSLR